MLKNEVVGGPRAVAQTPLLEGQYRKLRAARTNGESPHDDRGLSRPFRTRAGRRWLLRQQRYRPQMVSEAKEAAQDQVRDST